MMLRHFARDAARRWSTWEAPLKLSFIIAIAICIFLLAIGFGGPRELQLVARIGAFGTLLSLQLLFLWANRREISPYHQAQRHFIAGEFAEACDILEALPERGRESVDALTLLGNSYRHLGNYDGSQRALERALALKPNHHLALFSLGKLRLVQGDFEAAIVLLERSLDSGAPDIVKLELGQCRLLLGDCAGALRFFRQLDANLETEPARALLLAHYLHQLDGGPRPEPALIREQLAYWRSEAQSARGGAYGEHIESAVRRLDEALASQSH